MKNNSIFYFLFSRFLFVILLSIFYFLFSYSIVFGATLFLFPPSQTVYEGSSFITEVWLDAESESINAVEGYLAFPQDKLEILDISEGGSVLGIWLQKPSYSNQAGSISFLGGAANGFNGQGQLFSITFRAIGNAEESLSASINFQEDSRAFLNDGKGTRAALSFMGGNYIIAEKPENLPIVYSSSHPDENKWEAKNDFYLRWDLAEGVEYSYLLSHDSLAAPDEVVDKPEGELIWMGDIAYKGLGDGVYYFHLRERRNSIWGPKATRRAMIDKTPPEPVSLEVAEIEGKNYLVFDALDRVSGIDFYEVKEGEKAWQKIQSPYLLENQKLEEKILVRALDKAGNEILAEIAPPSLPQKFGWKDLVISFSFLVFLVVLIILWRKSRRTVLREM